MSTPDIPSTTPVSSRSRVEQALRWNIGSGAWKPGEAIPSERELASDLGIGRSTLRSAIDVLRAEGLLVTSIGRSGRTRVADPGQTTGFVKLGPQVRQDILDHFELRCAVEPEAAALAAERGTTQDFDRLRDILREPVTSVRTYHALQSQFHIAVADACGNSLIRKVVAELCVDFFGWADSVALSSGDGLPAAYRDFALTHKAIYETLMTRDSTGASSEIAKRLGDARDAFIAIVDSTGAR